MSKGKLSVVVGGQFGSEAKGHVVDFLSRTSNNHSALSERVVSVVRVGGPNAGHTVYGRCPKACGDLAAGNHSKEQHPWRLRTIPVGVVSNEHSRLYIAAGSEVDPEVLWSEINDLKNAGYSTTGRLMIDQSATWLEASHIDEERLSDLTERLGSTAKGIGAARADRIWRTAKTFGHYVDESGLDASVFEATETRWRIEDDLDIGGHVIIEGTQGYGLGLHTDHYPQVTSGDCRAIDFLAQAGISPWAANVGQLDVWITVRTRPIRVAGNSGPLLGETSWEAIGLPEEKTTVTQKVRRVGKFDPSVVRDAVWANGGPADNVRIALMMVDYEIPEVAGKMSISQLEPETYSKLLELCYRIFNLTGAKVGLVGTGPNTMIDVRDKA